MSTAMNEIQRTIRELTCDLDTPEYVEFLCELAEWAVSEANMIEYVAESDFEMTIKRH